MVLPRLCLNRFTGRCVSFRNTPSYDPPALDVPQAGGEQKDAKAGQYGQVQRKRHHVAAMIKVDAVAAPLCFLDVMRREKDSGSFVFPCSDKKGYLKLVENRNRFRNGVADKLESCAHTAGHKGSCKNSRERIRVLPGG